jgi:hypothetical protein
MVFASVPLGQSRRMKSSAHTEIGMLFRQERQEVCASKRRSLPKSTLEEKNATHGRNKRTLCMIGWKRRKQLEKSNRKSLTTHRSKCIARNATTTQKRSRPSGANNIQNNAIESKFHQEAKTRKQTRHQEAEQDIT